MGKIPNTKFQIPILKSKILSDLGGNYNSPEAGVGNNIVQRAMTRTGHPTQKPQRGLWPHQPLFNLWFLAWHHTHTGLRPFRAAFIDLYF